MIRLKGSQQIETQRSVEKLKSLSRILVFLVDTSSHNQFVLITYSYLHCNDNIRLAFPFLILLFFSVCTALMANKRFILNKNRQSLCSSGMTYAEISADLF